MSFTSFTFLFLFFPLCIAGYLILFFIQQKLKKETLRICDIYLVMVGLAFYSWALLDGILYFCIYILIVYFMGKAIGSNHSGKKNKVVISIATLVLSGILFFCKYFDFIISNLNYAFGMEFDAFYIIVPLGVSFITFSAISYIIDVYRGDTGAGNLLDVALFLTFFPKVVSGPIVLWKDFQPQMKQRKMSDITFMNGLNRIMIGYAKKAILADTFGDVVNNIHRLQGSGIDMATAWGCAFLYMLEIYYDFSGYSDIAVGLASLFGFSFKENFHFPYISASITEFWKRWHISLGTWFREYIYIPMGGNRKGTYRTLFNLFIVFLVTGIWHGAGWNYIAWGVLNGICVLIERCIRDKVFYKKTPYIVKWAASMLIVLISWVIFSMPNLSDAIAFLKIMFGITNFETVNFTFVYYFTPKIILWIIISVFGATALHKKWFAGLSKRINQSKVLFVLQEIVLFALLALAVVFMVNSTYSPFIYFQY